MEAIVLGIDVEKERISLGIERLEGDPFSNFVAMNDKGSIVDGVVKTVDAKGAVVQLSTEVETTCALRKSHKTAWKMLATC